MGAYLSAPVTEKVNAANIASLQLAEHSVGPLLEICRLLAQLYSKHVAQASRISPG